MKNVNKILNVVLRILLIIVLGATAVLSLTMAYIMFAPDTFPKPFQLMTDGDAIAMAATDAHGETTDGHSESSVPGFAPPPTATPEPQIPELHQGEGVMVEMTTKIVNLDDPTGNKYIRTTIVLEFYPSDLSYFTMEHEAQAAYLTEFQAEIDARMPLMDDIVISLLSTKTYESLYTAEGKELLRGEIMDEINSRMPEFYIMSVYFTEFVVQ